VEAGQVLEKANEYHSDFLLLGGDLFDENKPSRSAMVRTIKMFKKACFGDREESPLLVSRFVRFVTAYELSMSTSVNRCAAYFLYKHCPRYSV
jgi:DNA repair exonuclease SbcCD nuclease subunit